jgi:hypothetical protein
MEYVEKPKKSYTFTLADRCAGVITIVPLELGFVVGQRLTLLCDGGLDIRKPLQFCFQPLVRL